MPTVTYDTLFALQTPLNPGAYVNSALIDVNDATVVNLMFGTAVNPKVHWRVCFGPAPNNGYAPCRVGTFAQYNVIALSVPVFGPKLLVSVNNDSAVATVIEGNIRIVHDLAP
jgi:hypothetical protein